MKLLIDITENTYNSVCNESMLPPNVENVIEGIKSGQLLPKDATNGDMIKAMFPNCTILRVTETNIEVDMDINRKDYWIPIFDLDWWNAPYRG